MVVVADGSLPRALARLQQPGRKFQRPFGTTQSWDD